jgi:hypothetical protein
MWPTEGVLQPALEKQLALASRCQGQFDQSRRRGVGKAGISQRDKGHKPAATVRPTDDIAGDNLELWRACTMPLVPSRFGALASVRSPALACYRAHHHPNPTMARRPTKVSRRIRVSERIIDGSFLIPRRETAYREVARIPLERPPNRPDELYLQTCNIHKCVQRYHDDECLQF